MSKLFRTGGGFLNGVAGTITGVRTFAEASKSSEFSKLMVQLSIRQDGADVDVSPWPFFAGSAEGCTFNDGPSFESDNDDFRLGGKTDWSGFLIPMLALSPELEDRLTPTDYSGLIGVRCQFVQETDVEKTKQFGKQKGKEGKEYDRKNLRVESVLDLPTVKAKTNGAAKVPAKGAKAKGADVSGLAAETVVSILTDNDGTLAFPKLKMKVFGAFGAKHPQRDQRDAVLAYLGDSTNIAGLDGVEFDGKTQTISLA
jgi:hypothetical protein